MRKRIESDLLLKILSVVFAFLLWMFVINTDNPVIKKTFSDVPVDMLNEQVLDELNQTYKIESGDTVSFTVDTKGSPGKGYVLGSIDYQPKHIEITGSKEDLDKIDSIKLAKLDISDSTKSIEKTIKASDIKLPDGISFVKSVDKIKNVVIRANIEKKKSRTLTIPTSQIALINNTKNYAVTFDNQEIKVKISGLRSVIDKVVVKDLNPKLDMRLYEPGTHTVQIQLTKIKNMTIEDNVSAKITVE